MGVSLRRRGGGSLVSLERIQRKEGKAIKEELERKIEKS